VLDASALLIPLYGLLPPDDPRVLATVQRVVDELTIDGFVYRFDPQGMPGVHGTMGEFEAAFVPCTLWLASVYRMLGHERASLATLQAVESVAGSTLLLGEAVDPRTRTFAGNFPLAFSHAERVRTALTPVP
jgi:GH15 family glucan-1,4-alpha-glucosidase